jgi:protoporphyrinogen/coproporphyrinogen III oxidase
MSASSATGADASATAGRRVAVVGGGIAGLAAAWELVRFGHTPIVFEADDRLGGKIRTSPLGEIERIDEGADAFLARVPFAVELAGELGLGDTLVAPATGHAFVVHAGRLHGIPDGLVLGVPAGLAGLARSRLISLPGKLRAALEVVLPRRDLGHDSLGRCIRDRFGDEILDRLVDPLVGSINAGGADELSLVASTPQIAAAAERHRSLLLGLRRTPPSGTGPVFLAPQAGMGALVERLEVSLRAAKADIRTSTTVVSIERGAGGRGHVVNGEDVDAVIVAAPSFAAAHLLRAEHAPAADLLQRIPYAGVVMVTLLVPGDQLRSVPVGSGYLVPKPEQGHVTAVSFASRKWAHWKQQDGSEVLRISLGRHGRQAPLDLDDDDVLRTALGEVRGHLGLADDLTPSAVRISRWERSFPQYLPHHGDLVDAIEGELRAGAPTLVLAGAGLRGIGIPACIRQGRTAASATVQQLQGSRE